MSRGGCAAASVSIHARTDVEIHAPEGSRVWLTTLLSDLDCDCVRLQLSIETTAETEQGAREAIALVRERLAGAISEADRG